MSSAVLVEVAIYVSIVICIKDVVFKTDTWTCIRQLAAVVQTKR